MFEKIPQRSPIFSPVLTPLAPLTKSRFIRNVIFCIIFYHTTTQRFSRVIRENAIFATNLIFVPRTRVKFNNNLRIRVNSAAVQWPRVRGGGCEAATQIPVEIKLVVTNCESWKGSLDAASWCSQFFHLLTVHMIRSQTRKVSTICNY